MERHRIKYLLTCAGTSPKQIAEDCQVTIGAVSHVLAGRHHSAMIEHAIAQALGLPIHKVFPKKKFKKN